MLLIAKRILINSEGFFAFVCLTVPISFQSLLLSKHSASICYIGPNEASTPPWHPDSASGWHLLWCKLTNRRDSPSHLWAAPWAPLHHGNSENLGSPLFSELNIPILCVCVLIQSCPTLCNPVDCSPSGSSVHGVYQARILEWVTIFFSRGYSQNRD